MNLRDRTDEKEEEILIKPTCYHSIHVYVQYRSSSHLAVDRAKVGNSINWRIDSCRAGPNFNLFPSSLSLWQKKRTCSSPSKFEIDRKVMSACQIAYVELLPKEIDSLDPYATQFILKFEFRQESPTNRSLCKSERERPTCIPSGRQKAWLIDFNGRGHRWRRRHQWRRQQIGSDFLPSWQTTSSKALVSNDTSNC